MNAHKSNSRFNRKAQRFLNQTSKMGNAQIVPDKEVQQRLASLGERRGKELVQSSKNCAIVERYWVEATNKHDAKRFFNFCAPGAEFHFKGAETGMPLDAFLEECKNLLGAFPDVISTFDSIEEVHPNVVKLTNFASKGTHMGPFGFGPFPEVQPTGKVVEEGGCEITFYMNRRGKMTKLVVDILEEGVLVGPPGYYTKIGGKMVLEDDASTASTSQSSVSV